MPLAIFCHYETNLTLLKPIVTWFATNFLMVEKLFKLRPTIEQIIVNLDLKICQHIVWHPSSKVTHEGESFLNLHQEGQVLGYLC